jgi:hypothetical protein
MCDAVPLSEIRDLTLIKSRFSTLGIATVFYEEKIKGIVSRKG